MDVSSRQKILKKEVNQLPLKPLRFARALLGVRKVKVQENVNIFRLGKQCSQCEKLIVHRETISVCSCYLFAHKDCLKNQLILLNLSECSEIECQSCKGRVNAIVDSDYFFKINVSIEDLVILFICAALCAASMIYLVNFKNAQRQEMRQQELKTHIRHSSSWLSIQEIIPVTVLFVFGTLFWLCIIGMVLNKKTKITDIIGTNTEIKVSAFEQLEIKIREQSCQSIPVSKETNQL